MIKTKDLEWVEACGNCENLHIKNDIYPMRITMSVFVLKSHIYGLICVHKSFAVNVNSIHFIDPLPSGDGEIVMH